MISNREIILEKNFYEELSRKYKKKARHHPDGEICFKYQHGKHRPYLKLNGEIKYLKAEDASLVSRLLSKKIDNHIVECIEDDLVLLKDLQQRYKGAEWIFGDQVIRDIEQNIGKGFKMSDYIDQQKGPVPVKTQSAEFLNDKKIHKTPAGVTVRSKAELVIATFLEMKGVEYIYEKPLKLYMKTVAPDFTIRRASDGKTIIWEHFGMMDDPEYYESRMEVLSDYHHAGWLPYENFIATFGERNSPIDMTTLETICETMLR